MTLRGVDHEDIHYVMPGKKELINVEKEVANVKKEIVNVEKEVVNVQ